MDEAEKRFPGDSEFTFWRLFIRERVVGELVPDEAYDSLVQNGEELAYLPLYVRSRGSRYSAEVDMLLQRASPNSTRNRWILSYAPTRQP